MTSRSWRKLAVAATVGAGFSFSALGAFLCAASDPTPGVLGGVVFLTAVVVVALAFGLDAADKKTWLTKVARPLMNWLSATTWRTVLSVLVCALFAAGSYVVFWRALTKAEAHCPQGSTVSWDRLFGSKGEMQCNLQCSPAVWHPRRPFQTDRLLWVADGKSERTWLERDSKGFYVCAPNPTDAHVECADFKRIANEAGSPKCGGRTLARYRLKCSLSGKAPRASKFEVTADEGAYIVFHEPEKQNGEVFKAEERAFVLGEPRFGSFVTAVSLTVALAPDHAETASYYLELCSSAPTSELHVEEKGK